MEDIKNAIIEELQTLFEAYTWWKNMEGADDTAEMFKIKFTTCKEFAEKITGERIIGDNGTFTFIKEGEHKNEYT